MRILWHSVSPTAPTGYGQQTALWVPRLASLGHEVAISAYAGYAGPEWEGHRVYDAAGKHRFGADVLPGHARSFGADLIVTLMDAWALGPLPPALPLACWAPVDCAPLGRADKLVLEGNRAIPIAMSRHGEKMMTAAGLVPYYVPHGIDLAVFRPREDRKALRQAMGVDDRFVIGINATTEDDERKGWFEQLSAFARLHRKHPDAFLLAHTKPKSDAIDLKAMAEDLGVSKAIGWSDPARRMATPAELAGTYAAMDLYTGCSWAEGFGLTLAEAQACGTPAVATRASAMAEVCGGWLVDGEPSWRAGLRATWVKPSIGAIHRVYEQAYQRGGSYQAKKARARDHASAYDADRVLTLHWKPVLSRIEARL